MKDDCIFCKLANGVIPTNSIYEDDDFNVILDLGPATKGHALILPKEHYANIYEIPEETAGKVMMLAKRLAIKMTDRLGADGFNLVQNNNECAGQTVFHFHLHLCKLLDLLLLLLCFLPHLFVVFQQLVHLLELLYPLAY